MRMTLHGHGGFVWDGDWDYVLSLAQRFGWEPAGTVVSEERQKPEHGSVQLVDYTNRAFFNAVTDMDALHLAAALEKGLQAKEPDVSDTNLGVECLQNASNHRYCCRQSRKEISEFIEYCREGGFAFGTNARFEEMRNVPSRSEIPF